jgi:hypothetical protein
VWVAGRGEAVVRAE